MNHEHTLDLTEKVGVKHEKAPQSAPKKILKKIAWFAFKYLTLAIILATVGVLGYKAAFTNVVLEGLEADFKQSSIALDTAVENYAEIKKLMEKSKKELETAADDKCNKYSTLNGYKEYKGLSTDGVDVCAITNELKAELNKDF